MRCYVGVLFLVGSLSGCAVLAVTDAAVTVAVTTAEVAAKVVKTTVDVVASGVKAVVGQSGDRK